MVSHRLKLLSVLRHNAGPVGAQPLNRLGLTSGVFREDVPVDTFQTGTQYSTKRPAVTNAKGP